MRTLTQDRSPRSVFEDRFCIPLLAEALPDVDLPVPGENQRGRPVMRSRTDPTGVACALGPGVACTLERYPGFLFGFPAADVALSCRRTCKHMQFCSCSSNHQRASDCKQFLDTCCSMLDADVTNDSFVYRKTSLQLGCCIMSSSKVVGDRPVQWISSKSTVAMKSPPDLF